jgi:hypothetical protein
MRTLLWDRPSRIADLRSRIWLYLTPSVTAEQALLDAAALLQMHESDVLTLGQLHFLLSEEVGRFLEDLPSLVRRLANTTAHEEEVSTERIRGSIDWGKTVVTRAATGMPHAYVTHPARRAYQTPENELLVHVLDAVARTGRDTTWFNRSTGAASIVNERVDGAEYWRQHRVLLDIQRRPVTPRTTTRVRAGRNRKPYASTIAAYEVLRSLVRQLDRAAVRDVVERRALVVTDNSVLFEMMCTFEVIDALAGVGWDMDPLRLIQGKLRLDATRGAEKLRLWYQAVPEELRAESRYLALARRHAVPADALRPDLVLRMDTPYERRWLIVEAKLGDVSFGSGRSVEGSARAALKDLLMYREDFSAVLDGTGGPYGLGVAWGADLASRDGPVLLATPDRLAEALSMWEAT